MELPHGVQKSKRALGDQPAGIFAANFFSRSRNPSTFRHASCGQFGGSLLGIGPGKSRPNSNSRPDYITTCKSVHGLWGSLATLGWWYLYNTDLWGFPRWEIIKTFNGDATKAERTCIQRRWPQAHTPTNFNNKPPPGIWVIWDMNSSWSIVVHHATDTPQPNWRLCRV